MTQSAVTFESVSKVYRRGAERTNIRAALPGRLGRPRVADGFAALRDISFEVAPAEIVGIIGPNGAGKSTTLKLVARVIAPTSGRVVTRGRIASLIELGVGFHQDLTGAENVRFSAAVLGMSQREVARRYDQIVEFAGIEAFMGTPVKRYSSGMLARLGFAVASHLDAEVVLVDEVLSVGDAAFQRRGYERMRMLRESGSTLLFVTHNLLLVPEVCQRAMLLQGGRIVDQGDPRAVVDRYVAGVATTDVPTAPGEAVHVKIRGIELSAPAIRPGESLTVGVTVDVVEPIADTRLTVVFVASSGMHAAGMDVAGSEDALSKPGRWRFEGVLPTVALIPDQYRVAFTVVQQVNEMPLTVDQAAGQIAVIGDDDDRQYGVAQLSATWKVKGATQEAPSY